MTAETARISRPRSVVDAFARRHRSAVRPRRCPGSSASRAYFVFPDYLALGAQVLATILFGLSLDLILGYAGIVTLGHAAFFGTGAYVAGLLAAHGWGEPITGLVDRRGGGRRGRRLRQRRRRPAHAGPDAADADARRLRPCSTRRPTRRRSITGGADGLSGMEVWPVLGFRFDLFGQTAYWYCLGVLFVCWLVARAHRAFAVRPLAHRHPRERAAHARDRLAGVLAPAHHLHDLGGDGGRGGRAHRARRRRSSGWAC